MPSEAADLRLVSEASADMEDSRDQDENCTRQTISYPCGRCTDKENHIENRSQSPKKSIQTLAFLNFALDFLRFFLKGLFWKKNNYL